VTPPLGARRRRILYPHFPFGLVARLSATHKRAQTVAGPPQSLTRSLEVSGSPTDFLTPWYNGRAGTNPFQYSPCRSRQKDPATNSDPNVIAGKYGSSNIAVKKQKKRKPQFSPNPHEDPTSSQEETDDDMGNVVPPPPPPPAPLEGLRSPTEPFTLTELEDMHNKIVQKCAPLIDGFNALNIFEVSYVEQKLKEIKSAFKKDYDRNNLRGTRLYLSVRRERERERERGSLTTKKRMRQGASVCVYDGEHRPFRSYTLHLSLGLSPVGADGGRLSRQTLLSCSFSSTLRAAFFRGTEPVFLICKFPSTMEHGQSHGIVVVLPVSAATAATESLS